MDGTSRLALILHSAVIVKRSQYRVNSAAAEQVTRDGYVMVKTVNTCVA